MLAKIEAFSLSLSISLSNKIRTQKLSFNDTVDIQLVVKSNTLLDFEKRSSPHINAFWSLKLF